MTVVEEHRLVTSGVHAFSAPVVALRRHAGDLAQTVLFNLLFPKRLETMAPRWEYFGGLSRLIAFKMAAPRPWRACSPARVNSIRAGL